ncbi:efflux RND transporter periplasmic adaptor subunit [Phreatobacter sp. AB_2022a]|uniref:efflux RND transporter periplasmic adaptor subunit n=1 Tax=Phreatobacter sp. AB_2022a TaxID=3003134 RepID=UPI0022874DFD|nr:efflux RND transporter periplasmic adaptor subunit [Phreatobacter sp. AB_2022a]MCZ0734475.1 efflux RND transporter periplasmic adaptor subunit [Phreatobacter sp. AB_2022a]
MLRVVIVFGLLAIAAGIATWRPDLAEQAYVKAQGLMKRDTPAAEAATRRNAPPAVTVTLARAERRPMPITVDAIGTVQPIASIQIKPRLDSQVVAVHVAEGALVKEGDLLFSLDDRTLKAQIAQVEAQIARDKAQVEQATRDRDRAADLANRRVGSEVARDNAITALKTAQAQLAADEANRDALVTQLSYTRITAPVAGRIGSIAAKPGAFVRSADTAPLATVNQVDPIYIAFAVPQNTFYDMRAVLSGGPDAVNRVTVEATAGGKTARGAIAFIENTIDQTTGTVIAKARMENGSEQLWPGAFVPVKVTLGMEADAVVIPTSAVQIGQNGPYVFAVVDGRATLANITVVRSMGDIAVVSSGLSGGEEVVTSGQLRLVAGTPVVARPSAAATETVVPGRQS